MDMHAVGVPAAAPTAASGSGLDAMARCYPVEQLSEYLSDIGQSYRTHRRCRGGLLSLMRHIVAISPTPTVRHHDAADAFSGVTHCTADPLAVA